jgi:hypothetical protein
MSQLPQVPGQQIPTSTQPNRFKPCMLPTATFIVGH